MAYRSSTCFSRRTYQINLLKLEYIPNMKVQVPWIHCEIEHFSFINPYIQNMSIMKYLNTVNTFWSYKNQIWKIRHVCFNETSVFLSFIFCLDFFGNIMLKITTFMFTLMYCVYSRTLGNGWLIRESNV